MNEPQLMTDDELGAAFAATIGRVATPQVDLSSRVVEDVTPPVRRLHPATAMLRPLAGVAVAAALAALLVFPSSRSAIAGLVGIGGTTIGADQGSSVPDGVVADSAGSDSAGSDSAGSGSAGSDSAEPIVPSVNDLGVSFPVPNDGEPGHLPIAQFASPAAIFDDTVRGRSYVWQPSTNLPEIADTGVGGVLSVRHLIDGAGPLTTKSGAGLGLEEVVLETAAGPLSGLWVDGDHAVVQNDGRAATRSDQVLIWVDGVIEYRWESALSLDEARAVAGGVDSSPDLLGPG